MKKLTLLLALLIPIFTFSQIIHIPNDYPTIREGIDAANHGDTVLVADGIYYESLNFKGKAITLASYFLIDGNRMHIDSTVIDGRQNPNPDSAYVIYFVNNEDSTSVLVGFTMKYRVATLYKTGEVIGGGFFLQNSSPKMHDNKFIGQILKKKIKQKHKTFITWLTLKNSPNTLKGCLYQVNDSSLSFVLGATIKQGKKTDLETSLIYVNQIEIIEMRNKYSIRKGVVIGLISGIATGILIGLQKGDYFERIIRGGAYGILFGIIGVSAGALVGSIKVTIPIRGHQTDYEYHRKKLKRYSVK